jgi:serine/threonine protein kinase
MSTAELPQVTATPEEPALCPFCGAATREGQPFCTTCGQPGTPYEEGFRLHGAYRIAATLSTSNTGAVYQARDERRKRDVAIKELLPPAGSSAADRADLAARFAHEVKLLEHLKHPCLPEVFAGFTENGRHYLVTSLLPGQSLQGALVQRGQGFPELQARGWMSHLLSLLEYLEERHPPFTHGEILPSHVMLRSDGFPCVIGFGLAPRLGLRPYLVLPGQLPPDAQGSLAPVVMKQGKSGSPSGPEPRDDIYGLGATLHALLTGRNVFGGANDPEQPFLPVRLLAPRVSVGVAEVVNRALAIDPALRYPSAVAMQATLAPLLGAAPRPLPKSPATAPKPSEGRPMWPILGALILVIVAVAGFLLFHSSTNLAPESGSRPSPAVPAAAPPPAHSVPIAETFIRPSAIWPNGKLVYRKGSELWLDNTAGAVPLKAPRLAYSTGLDGFTLRATLRQVRGPATAPYGIMAADQPRAQWDNVELLVRGTGQWSLVRNQGGKSTQLVPWRQALALRLGHNSPNELQLKMIPGKGTKHGTFVATINGQRVAAVIPAWSTAPVGRVGIVVAPGAQIVSDGLTVDPPGAQQPSVNEHFLDNRLGWSSGKSAGVTSLLVNGLLRLHPASGQSWAEATARPYKTLPHNSAFGQEAALSVRAGKAGPAGGGLVFARSIPPRAGKHASPVTLAAIVNTSGQVLVVEHTSKHTIVVLGPVASSRVRTGYGLNVLRVQVMRRSDLIQAHITVNGGAPILYSRAMPGLEVASGVAAVGADSTVTASAVRLYG